MQVHNSPDITLEWLASEALTRALPGGATRVARKCLGAIRVAQRSWVGGHMLWEADSRDVERCFSSAQPPNHEDWGRYILGQRVQSL